MTADPPSKWLRADSGLRSEDARDGPSQSMSGTSHYGDSGRDVYVLTFTPRGYDRAVRVSVEIPAPGEDSASVPKRIDREVAPTPRDPAVTAFLREDKAFERMLPNLLNTCPGRFVAVMNEQVIDEDADEFALGERIQRSHRGEFVLIRRIERQRPEDYLESPEFGLP